MADRLLKFTFAHADVRGGLVHLAGAWQEMSAHHDYPAPVRRLLGELVAASALLASNIKFDGTLVLQVHGDGPVKLLVVECQADLTMRATAKLREEAVPEGASLCELINRNGRGRCVITLDPSNPAPGQQAYQGIVPIEGGSVAEMIESYMRQSEQLAARLALAADGRVCAGLLLQRLPDHGGRGGGQDADAWNRAVTLGGTLTADELLALAPEDVLRRLYGQEALDRYAPLTPRFACRCSRERIGRMLLSLGREEVDSIIEELQAVTVTCDFCGRQYSLDAVDVAQLFASGSSANPASTSGPH